jgi:hypothetical protein
MDLSRNPSHRHRSKSSLLHQLARMSCPRPRMRMRTPRPAQLPFTCTVPIPVSSSSPVSSVQCPVSSSSPVCIKTKTQERLSCCSTQSNEARNARIAFKLPSQPAPRLDSRLSPLRESRSQQSRSFIGLRFTYPSIQLSCLNVRKDSESNRGVMCCVPAPRPAQVPRFAVS